MRTELRTQARRGFTLVELLVAMALIVFVMAVLSEAFVAALETFYQLKATGDMDEKMRAAVTLMRRDLRANHLHGGGKPLSGQSMPPDQVIPPSLVGAPIYGFFRVYEGATPGAIAGQSSINEGVDPDGIPSFRANQDMLHLLVDLESPNNSPEPINPNINFVQTSKYRREQYFSAYLGWPNYPGPPNPPPPFTSPSLLTGGAVVPPASPYLTDTKAVAFQDGVNFYSQRAEVAWFMRATGQTTPPTTAFGGVRLFSLYRRQLLVINNGTKPGGTASGVNSSGGTRISSSEQPYYCEVSCLPDPTSPGPTPPPLYFNTVSSPDLNAPIQRFGMLHLTDPAPTSPPYPAGATAAAGLLRASDPVLSASLGVTVPSYPLLGEDTATISAPVGTPVVGADLVLTDVISFDIKLSFGPTVSNGEFLDVADPAVQAFTNGNPAFPVGTGPWVYDTWCGSTNSPYYDYSAWATGGANTSMPLMPGALGPVAVQIVIRVWDRKTEKTRQITLVQNL